MVARDAQSDTPALWCANEAYRSGSYTEAIQLYVDAMREHPALCALIRFNIAMAEARARNASLTRDRIKRSGEALNQEGSWEALKSRCSANKGAAGAKDWRGRSDRCKKNTERERQRVAGTLPENASMTFPDLLSYSLFSPELRFPLGERETYFMRYMQSHEEWLATKFSNRPEKHRVSVIMPTYNRRSCIGRAISSVLRQTYQNWELIIVDDGGHDDVGEVIEKFEDPRIRSCYLTRNQGCAAARNEAIKYATGDIIAYLDSDNWMAPKFLTLMVNALIESPASEIAYCAQIVYRAGDDGEEPEFLRFAPFHRPSVENGNYIDLNSIVHYANVFAEHGFFDAAMRRLVDWEFLLRVTETKVPLAVPVLQSHYVRKKGNGQVTETEDLALAVSQIDRRRYGARLGNDIDLRATPEAEEFYSATVTDTPSSEVAPVAIVIPSYEALGCLQACVAAIEQYTRETEWMLIVVDNGSSQQVREYLSDLERKTTVKVIQNDQNWGFTYAVNQGISAAPINYDVVIMNNDAIVTPGWLSALQAVKEAHGDAQLIVPRQVLPAGEQSLKVHRPDRNAAVECDVSISAHHNNLVTLGFDPGRGYAELRFAPFFCVYLPRETIERVGLLDEKNGPHYRSDRLYCDRIRYLELGPILYTPYAKVYHLVQRATKELKEKNRDEYEALFVRNDWRLLEKRGGGSSQGMENAEEAAIVNNSGLMDYDYYWRQISGDLEGCSNVAEHYLRYGEGRGLKPNAVFEGQWYRERYPDVARKGVAPLLHYIRAGDREGRMPHPAFDSRWYAMMYGSGLSAGQTTLAHYLKSGAAQGFDPHYAFDGSWYEAEYMNEASGYSTPLEHFIERGLEAGAKPNRWFSEARLRGMRGCAGAVRFEQMGVAEYGPINRILSATDDCPVIEECELSVCVHLHLFNLEMAEHFAGILANIPYSFTLLLSVPTRAGVTEWRAYFGQRVAQVKEIVVREVENRGRDVAPWVVAFREEISRHDLMLHIHSKRTAHNSAHRCWRQFLEHCLIGRGGCAHQIVQRFVADPALGLVSPAYYGTLLTQPHWQGNRHQARELIGKLSGCEPPKECPDYPAGSFFWARTGAVAPLLEANFKMEDFPAEKGQIDGTLAHAIERVVGFVPRVRGYRAEMVTVAVAAEVRNGNLQEQKFSRRRLSWLKRG